MGRFGGAQVLPAYQEDEELFETSSSISGDSDDEARLSDFEVLEGLQVAPKTVRRLNSDSLYDMSSVKAELPVKKGLSRYYDGKSQSYACMSEVRCLEDLRKKSPYKKIKACDSFVDLDDGNQEACRPNSKGIGKSCANLMARNNTATNMLYRAPAIPVNKSAYRQ
ncbi:unnamed protein product [Alopecurus aequalis]